MYEQYWANTDYDAPSDTFAASIARLVDRGGPIRVADLGCGLGRHALYAAGQGARVIAIDHGEAGLARLQARVGVLPIEVIHGDFVTWARQNEGLGLDGVVCFDAIHHVAPIEADVVEVLRAIGRTVRFGGLLTISVLADIDYGRGGAPDGRLLVSADRAEALLDLAFAGATATRRHRTPVVFERTVNLDGDTLVETHYRATRVVRLIELP